MSSATHSCGSMLACVRGRCMVDVWSQCSRCVVNFYMCGLTQETTAAKISTTRSDHRLRDGDYECDGRRRAVLRMFLMV